MKKGLLKNQKGFTLIEIIAVLVILGIPAAIAVPSS
jgi:prepilin-type N-terminal cleavage/methylation domain-containing protein